MKLLLEPSGWACPLAQCPSGPFIWEDRGFKVLGFKTEYETNDHIEVYNCVGEALWAGRGSHAEVAKLVVQPVTMVTITDVIVDERFKDV